MKFQLSFTKLGVLLLVFLLSGCGDQETLVHIQGTTMGTTYSIKYVGKENQSDKVKEKIEETLLEFDLEMSNWNPDSWVSLFNSAYRSGQFKTSENVKEIMTLALDLHKKSKGAFDISISPLIEHWGFFKQNRQTIPTPKSIEKIKSRTGSNFLSLNSAKNELTKTRANIQINCSAIAKGFGVDLIAKVLEESFKRKSFMVEIGGEVRCKGTPLNRPSWKLGIRQPDPKMSRLYGIVDLNNQGLATSGDYHNFFEVEGKRYSHIIDPTTGYPVAHKLCSVSVVSPSCALSDGLATACLVLGVEKGLELVEQYQDAHVLMLERMEDGSLKQTKSKGFNFELKSAK